MSGAPEEAAAADEAGELQASGAGPVASGSGARGGEEEAPCLRCGMPLPVRLMGCKGGHCPNCGHPYPHGDCSD